jgi:DNA helicase-2/ATP-dependent DNA helicase PcrA
MISGAKARGQSPGDLLAAATAQSSGSKHATVSNNAAMTFASVYTQYEQVLKEQNSLDFDSLLSCGVELFSSYSQSVEWCQHILVDELHVCILLSPSINAHAYPFSQDTNQAQFEIMVAFSATHGGVTIVGDPDQSSECAAQTRLPTRCLYAFLSLRLALRGGH